jgi:hypothetical protein
MEPPEEHSIISFLQRSSKASPEKEAVLRPIPGVQEWSSSHLVGTMMFIMLSSGRGSIKLLTFLMSAELDYIFSTITRFYRIKFHFF